MGKFLIIDTKKLAGVIMNLWQRYLLSNKNADASQGLSLHFEKGIEPQFRTLCMQFAAWLRKHYSFPVHINIYIKDCEKIRLVGGQMAYGGFRYFENRPPYIRIPARVEPEVREAYEDMDIHYAILGSLAHELTHYYQWVAGSAQTEAVSERQANYFRFRIIEQFCKDCDLPY